MPRAGKSTETTRERERLRKRRYRQRKREAANQLGRKYREVPMKSVDDYPKQYMSIAMAATAGEAIDPILVVNEAAGISIRNGFNRFKFALRNDPVTAVYYEAAANLVISVKKFEDGSGRWIVEFTPRFYALQAAALKGERVVLEEPDGLPRIEQPRPDPTASQKFVETQYGQQQVPKPQVPEPRQEQEETSPTEDKHEKFYENWLRQPSNKKPE